MSGTNVPFLDLTVPHRELREQLHAVFDVALNSSQFVGGPREPEWSRPVYHMYAVRVADRDRMQRHLAERGIGTGIHYPVPLNRLKAYDGLRFGVDAFPVAERLASEVIPCRCFRS